MAVAASLTLKFAGPESLADALRTFAGGQGTAGVCIQVVKYYELGDVVQVHLEAGAEPLSIHGVVAWRKPGYIGVRFDPRTAPEAKVFSYFKHLMGELGRAASVEPPVLSQTKPFAE